MICDHLRAFLCRADVSNLYTGFIASNELKRGLEIYVEHKVFFSTFCDILPKILADCYNVNILIVHENCDLFNPIFIEPDRSIPPLVNISCMLSDRIVSIVKRGLHYDAIRPNPTPSLFTPNHDPPHTPLRSTELVNISPPPKAQMEQSSSITPQTQEPCTSSSTTLPRATYGSSASIHPVSGPQPTQSITTNASPSITYPTSPRRDNSPVVRCVGLNVNGFLGKCENGILSTYLSQFDIICLSETKIQTMPPNFSKSELGDYTPVIKPRPEGSKHRYGGFHGLMALVHPSFKDPEVLRGTQAEAVLWIKISRDDMSCIIGALYIPCNGSIHSSGAITDDICLDLVALRAAHTCPIMLMGDANGHTGVLNDHLPLDDLQCQEFGIDLIEDVCIANHVALHARSNKDMQVVNKNGLDILSICKSSNLNIVNGRFGKDRGIGNYTNFKKTGENSAHEGVGVVDYCLVSNDLVNLVVDFEVDTFDRMLSDVHAPIIVSLKWNAKKTTDPPIGPPRSGSLH